MKELSSKHKLSQTYHPVIVAIINRLKSVSDIYYLDREIDLVARVQDIVYLFELVSKGQLDVSSSWIAMSKLYEYRYLHNIANAKLIIIFDNYITDYMIDYLENDRNINVLWNIDDQLHASPKTREELSFLWD